MDTRQTKRGQERKEARPAAANGSDSGGLSDQEQTEDENDSSSSSDEAESTKSKRNGKSYRINLRAFHKTKRRLETELRNRDACNDILDVYCTDAKDFEKINPLVTGQGSFPPIQAIYEHTREEGIETPWDGKADYTTLGRRILQDMESEEGIREVVKIEYGDEMGNSLATPGQMHKYPAKAWRSLERYLLARRKPETIMSRKKFKKLQKKTRAWLKEAHAMYSTLIDRLPSDGLHLADTIEMSNGPHLYSAMLTRFGSTHAQCLATLLRIITNLKLLAPDPKTGKIETIMDYFDRASRIARDAREFPAMNVPIPAPLLKVMILEGLVRSNKKKYSQMVLNEYANNLTSTIQGLRSKMQTVEGLREAEIISQYAPITLAEGDVMLGSSGAEHCRNFAKGRCRFGSNCKFLHERKPDRRNGRGGAFIFKGRRDLCRNFTTTGKCSFGSKCRFKHDRSIAKAYFAESLGEPTSEEEEGAKEAMGNHAMSKRQGPFGAMSSHDVDDESSSDF